MQKKEEIKLTDKQEKFCYEYVLHLNATKAALNAGYSEDSSYSIGWENLKKPEIQKRISEMQNNLAETAQISALRVLKAHEKIAFGNEETTRDRQKSLDAITAMLGFYAPTKQEITGTGLNIKFINYGNKDGNDIQ